jgi:hypothetical protein
MKIRNLVVKNLAAFALICGLSMSAQAQTCVTATAGGSWQNTVMASQTGTFTATFDATPSASPTNSVVGLSNGAQTAYANFACLARFNPTGDIDARNGAAYAAASTIPYSAGVSYHFRLVVNIAAQTYSIFVTPAGGSELTVGSNYAFRIAATTLNWYGVFVDVAASGGAGTVTVCNFSTGNLPQASAPSFSPAAGTYSSTQAISITTITSGASIRYTADGSTPSETAGTLYSGAVSLSSSTTLKAIAFASGDTDSSISSATYTIATGGGGGSLTGTSSNGFHSLAMSSAQTGTFTATFDAIPSVSPENAVVGLSSGAATAYTTISCIARFNPTGQIDAYNGTAYAAASTINYSAGVSYHFRLVVNVTAHTYSVFVTPAGGSELTVGSNYAFRSTANTATSLDNWDLDVNATPAGCSLTASNLSGTTGGGGGGPFTISASAGSGGSISPSGSVVVNSGSSQSFTITPNSGFTVASVTVDGANQGAVTSFTFSNVTANHTISAAFQATTTTHTITASAGSGGSISPSGSVIVNSGSSQSFTITPNSGFAVSSVTVDGASQGAVTSFTFSNVTADHTISAAFTPITFAITASAGSGGSISPTGTVTVNSGASQSFTITPNSGFVVSSVTVDGASQGAATSFTFSNVTANHTISAAFTSSGGLNPNLPPGQNFDLSNWQLQLPIGSAGSPTTISQPQLATFTDPYFFTDPNDGAMSFFTPENGVHTANSSFPRSELRELKPGGDWPLTGTHTQTATLIVHDTLAHVAIGQIHIGNGGTPTSTKPLLELFYYSTGAINLLLETSPAGGGPETLITTVPLGTKFSYTIKVVGNALTIIVNGVTKTFTIDSSYNSERFYFKAGDYLQTTGSSSTVGAHVSFYALKVVHQ